MGGPSRPSRPRPVLMVVVVLAVIGAGLSFVASERGAVGSADRYLGATNPQTTLHLSLSLRLPGLGEATGLLQQIYDPGSPEYHHYIEPAEFGRMFGLTGAQVASLEGTLRAGGLRVTGSYPQRTRLGVTGSVRDIERFFGVGIADFVDPAGTSYHAPMSQPAIPASIRDLVTGVDGLDDRPVWAPALRSLPGGHDRFPAGWLTPTALAKAYDIDPLLRLGYTGQGQTVAVISSAVPPQHDLDVFDARFGLPPFRIEHVPIDGGVAPVSGSEFGISRTDIAILEADLDVQMIHAVAPGASIVNFEAPNTAAAVKDALAAAVARQDVAIVSMSFGVCDDPARPPVNRSWAADLASGAMRGLTFFASSGDWGAYTCQRNGNHTDIRPTAHWPSDSPDVVGVGGTELFVRHDGSYVAEAGWVDALSEGGSGGGLNPSDGIPTWQDTPSIRLDNPKGLRQFPDVAGPADDVVLGIVALGQWHNGGGTSGATPFWAAIAALIRQVAAQEHVGPPGFLAQILYAVAAQPQDLPPFHDVVIGGNRLYLCRPGWDYATGLGTPNVANLAQDVVLYLRAHPGT